MTSLFALKPAEEMSLAFTVSAKYETAAEERFDILVPAGLSEREFVARLFMKVGPRLNELFELSLSPAHAPQSMVCGTLYRAEMPSYILHRAGKYSFSGENGTSSNWRAFRDGFWMASQSEALRQSKNH